MVQFYLPPDRWKPEDPTVHLEGDEARHARDVFRLNAGDPIRIFNGAGSAAQGRVESAAKTALRIRLERTLPADLEPRVHVDLAQALVPGETMDQIVRQAAELGVSRIWPVACDRSIVRLTADKRSAKTDHWKKTVLAACKQCDRNTLPEVMPVLTAKDLSEKFTDYGLTLAACPVNPEGELTIESSHFTRSRRLLIAIGPEGDFSPEEMRLFLARGARAVSLGPLILRSDTAAVSALSVLQFLIRRI